MKKIKTFDRLKLKQYIQDCLNLLPFMEDLAVVLRVSKQFKKYYASASCRDGVGYITISYKRFKDLSLKLQKEIMFHEVAHVVDWYLADSFPNSWKTDRKHGRTWKGLMKQLGLKPKIRYTDRAKHEKI